MASSGERRADARAGAILEPAWSLRWPAPELALVLAERASTVAKRDGDDAARLRAEAMAVSASCRLGRQLAVVPRAITAIGEAETTRGFDPVVPAMLRIELAGCARAAGVPLLGAMLLRPLLTGPGTGIRPGLRAAALVRLVCCLPAAGDRSDRDRLDGALAEADQLYTADQDLDRDTVLILRALLRSVVAATHRRGGDIRLALGAAEEGVDLLTGLREPHKDSGDASARVALQLVLTLLDLGRDDQARSIALRAMAQPLRAPAAASIGWLAMALAVRMQLPAGLLAPAMAVLREVVALAERHGRSALHAEALLALGEAHEQAGELAETLSCLREAQAVRARRAREVRDARAALVSTFGEPRNTDELRGLLGTPRSPGRRARAGRVQGAELVKRAMLGHQLDTPITQAVEPTVLLVDVTDPTRPTIGDRTLRRVAERLRGVVPAEASVVAVGGAELAVLLPTGESGGVGRWTERLRTEVAGADWGGLTVTVRPSSSPPKPEPEPVAPEPSTPARGTAAQPERPAEPRTPARGTATPPEQPAAEAALLMELPTVPLPGSRRHRKPEPAAIEEESSTEPLRRAQHQAPTSEATPAPPSGFVAPAAAQAQQPAPATPPAPRVPGATFANPPAPTAESTPAPRAPESTPGPTFANPPAPQPTPTAGPSSANPPAPRAPEPTPGPTFANPPAPQPTPAAESSPVSPPEPVSGSVFANPTTPPALPAPDPAPEPASEPAPALAEETSTGRHAGAGANTARSVLAELGISVDSGRGGRRRAPELGSQKETPETPATPTAEEPESKGGAKITPLSDSARDRSSGGRRRRSRSDLGLGDLLSEALIAYQNASESGESAGRADDDEDTDSRWPMPRFDYRAE